LLKKTSKKDIIKIYLSYYRDEKFVRVLKDKMPQLKDVADANFCDIGLEVKGDKIIISSAIDNLMKGASGQAVQNMNIILGVKEDTGLSILKEGKTVFLQL
jgi:N-acetyl-gamma-glutamyl-phosphate reductase